MTIPRVAARYSLYAALAAGVYVTAMSQIPERNYQWPRKLGPASAFIPVWTFFGPNPGVHDNHLLYRHELPSGSLTPWQEVEPPRGRRLTHMVWNPGARQNKAITDAVGYLAMLASDLGKAGQDNAIHNTSAYQTLLTFVTNHQPHPPQARAVQFLIARSTGCEETEEPRLLFVSDTHDLNPGSTRPRTRKPRRHLVGKAA
ncbi:MAG TPA: hypothetical protein VGS19_02985 [Streptosporangiaceae bacterium]|nr:hypothetical protein [Streptosporangiaceae bacterium]